MRIRALLALAAAAAVGVVCHDDLLDDASGDATHAGSDDPPIDDPIIAQPEPEPPPPGSGPLPAPPEPTDPAPPWSGPVPKVYSFPEDAQQASLDEANNLWVVTPNALYVLRPGGASFLRFTTQHGLRDYQILSV